MIWRQWKFVCLLVIFFSSLVLHTGKRWFIICPVVENPTTDAPEFSPPVPPSAQQTEGPGISKLHRKSHLQDCYVVSLLSSPHSAVMVSLDVVRGRKLWTLLSCAFTVCSSIEPNWESLSVKCHYFNYTLCSGVAEILITGVSFQWNISRIIWKFSFDVHNSYLLVGISGGLSLQLTLGARQWFPFL